MIEIFMAILVKVLQSRQMITILRWWKRSLTVNTTLHFYTLLKLFLLARTLRMSL